MDCERDAVIRRGIRLTGFVQGVGLRWRASNAAGVFGVTGWIRNDDDGSVYMELQGTEEQIDAVVSAIDRGKYVLIENMRVKTLVPEDDERGFSIRD